jgi:signal peptidase II
MFSESRWIFLAISLVAMIALPIFLYKFRKAPFLFGFSMSLIIGGNIGNMIDRLFAPNGGVTDFIEFAFIDFPIFNVADIAVCVGVGLYALYIVLDEVKAYKQRKAEKTAIDKTEEQHD